jgi:spore maturation protein CgeB
VSDRLDIAFFGSSLLSAYWNGAATYWRGIIKALYDRGHRIRFYESDAYQRQQHRDIDPPDWASVVVYSCEHERFALQALDDGRDADILIKCSGVGVFDDLLEAAVPGAARPGAVTIFWDVDAPATLERMEGDPLDPFREHVPRYDCILTYGGGDPVVQAYLDFGARCCTSVYNALDPQTHHAVPRDPRFQADLGLMANRLPDREARIEEFFLRAAAALPDKTFLLGGNGWQDKPMPGNVNYVGHVYTHDHNAFNSTPTAVLNVARDSMARNGFSPATRVFEAAGAGACLITDAWDGLDQFLEPDREVLVAADGRDVARLVRNLTPERARQIGQTARQRIIGVFT